MIQIQQLKLPVTHSQKQLEKEICRQLKVKPEAVDYIQIRKQSVDARKKHNEGIFYVYTIWASCANEAGILKNIKSKNISKAVEKHYHFPKSGTIPLNNRPIIIGSGPAGLFCAIYLAKNGFCPIVLERGEDAFTRKEKVDAFWEKGILDPNSNVQFGEGGAGTFSDGKLNTLVKDPLGRNQEVLKTFVKAGANPDILYHNKPHIGTDVLIQVVTNMRKEIISLGGEVRFSDQVTDFLIEEGTIKGVVINESETLYSDIVVLAIGHSARDTFQRLLERKVSMEAKSFAVGVRMEHTQELINQNQYGQPYPALLGAADYKVTGQSADGRGVYSFCMCPGGYVVNASSEPEHLAVNGMSYHDRAGKNANSAIIVSVTPKDFEGTGPLAGITFQRKLESAAYQAGKGKIPVQRYEDFKQNRLTAEYGSIQPGVKGEVSFGNVRGIFPESISQALIEGIDSFEGKIKGFSNGDALLYGVESRTSSPVRIHRNEDMEAPDIKGLYPCGEGAGYAGGITSAAMDGIKTAEAIGKKYFLPSK